jgi:hypothetical protein
LFFLKLGVVSHTFDPNTWEAEARARASQTTKTFPFLGTRGGGAVPVALRREQAGTLPLSYSLSYLEPANGYLTFFFFFKNYLFCRVWWRTPLIPALGRQRQADF